jgi:hypothetical protein
MFAPAYMGRKRWAKALPLLFLLDIGQLSYIQTRLQPDDNQISM